jgi:hypothetical protein
MISLLEDLDVYFDDEGEDAVLDGVPVRGLYGAPGASAMAGTGVGMSIDKPRFLVRSDSIPPRSTAPTGEPVLEFAVSRPDRDDRYLVTELQPDGTGMTTLTLSRHPDQS